MLLPIAMLLLTLVLPDQALRWTTVVVAGFLVVLNLAGLPCPGFYDNLLIGIGIVTNGLTIWQVWTVT